MNLNGFLNSKIWYLLPVFGVLLFGSLALFWPNLLEYYKERQREEITTYPFINKIDRELKGRIVRTDVASHSAGKYLYTMSNGDKFSLSGVTINKRYKFDYNLMKMLSVGDSIYKPLNSDSIYVYRKKQKYHYIIDKKIN